MTDPQRDRVLAAQRPPLAAGAGGDGGEFFFGGRQQLLAFTGPLFGQHGVVAAHQPLAGKLRGADLEQALLIEQRQLQRALLDEGLDLRGAQRADPVSGWFTSHTNRSARWPPLRASMRAWCSCWPTPDCVGVKRS